VEIFRVGFSYFSFFLTIQIFLTQILILEDLNLGEKC
jgi:hypothetical protein